MRTNARFRQRAGLRRFSANRFARRRRRARARLARSKFFGRRAFSWLVSAITAFFGEGFAVNLRDAPPRVGNERSESCERSFVPPENVLVPISSCAFLPPRPDLKKTPGLQSRRRSSHPVEKPRS